MKSTTYALIAVAAIAAFALLREHWSHVAGYWPYLLLLVCPLMHLFHGHGGHGDHQHQGSENDKKINPADGAASRPRYQSSIVRSLWHAQRHAVQVCYQRVPLPGTPVS